MKVLDVGCNGHKRGDIGIDLHRNNHVDVIADAHYLPFRNNVFDIVTSQHLVEHLHTPERAIKEMLRVSKWKVHVTCPHRFSHYAKITKEHLHFFNKRWFLQLAKKLNVEAFVKTSFDPLAYCGLGILTRPNELFVEYWKDTGKE